MSASPALDGVRILVVEDEPLIAMCFEAALQEAGAMVFVAANALEAYRLFEQVCSFELLITDLNLGHGESGFDVARAARQRDPSTPVIYLTGQSEDASSQGGVARAEFLTKPVPLAKLIRAAVQALIRPRASGQASAS